MATTKKKASAKKATKVTTKAKAGKAVSADALLSQMSAAELEKLEVALEKRRIAIQEAERLARQQEGTVEAEKAKKELDAGVAPLVKDFNKQMTALEKKIDGITNKPLKFTVNIPVTVTLTLENVDTDEIRSNLLDQCFDGNELNDLVHWTTDVVIGKLDVTDKQMKIIEGTNVLDDISTIIDDSVTGACSEIFDLFPEGAKITSIEKEISALEDIVEDISSKLSDFEALTYDLEDYNDTVPEIYDYL